MPRPLRPLARFADRAHRRLRQTRAGSVLIMVIALLVLMALIGTAFITTTQADRGSATKNGYNTQIDLLVQGVVELSQDAIVRDMLANNFTSNSTSPFLASRLPIVYTPVGGNNPYWPYISASPVAVSGLPQFESPDGVQYDAHESVAPVSKPITLPSGQTVVVPAIQFPGSGSTIPIAADTDGDGIADSALFRLPVGQLNGVTYYAAVRYIDNGSAVNVNVARKPNTEFAPQGNFFPSNIDLYGMLIGGNTEFENIHGYSLSGQANNPKAITVYNSPSRTDFQLTGTYEALYTMMGSRLNNPYRPQPTANATYFPFSVTESIALANHFCILDPESGLTALGRSAPRSLRPVAVTRTPYKPNEVPKWYNDSFYYGDFPVSSPTINPMPIRALLVTSNPASNIAPPDRFVDKGAYKNGQAYRFGERVYVEGFGRSFVCISSGTTVRPGGDPGWPAYWALEPWTSRPTKISVNTGTFGQLWAAYWAVMARAPRTGTGTAAMPNTDFASGPGDITQFRNPIRDPNNVQKFSGGMMRQLRSAIAAVNTIDLRDPNEDVTSRTIVLTDATNNPKFTVNVFGTEKQPYITEALAYLPPTGESYVAVELYNPQPKSISLKAIKLAMNDRATLPAMSLVPLNTLNNTLLPDLGPGQRVVLESNKDARPQAVNDYITFKQAQNPTAFTPIQVPELKKLADPPAGVLPELVLVRTRSVDGTPQKVSTAWNSYDEGSLASPKLNDWVPIDQLEFSGIVTDGAEHCYHYRRGSNPVAGGGAGNTAWHCVYPYDPVYRIYPRPAATPAPRSAGWLPDGFILGNSGPVNVTAGGLWLPKGPYAGVSPVDTNATYPTRALQIANHDAAGPNNPAYTSGVTFPYGAFARNGDILQVTFTGSYTIRPYNPSLAALQGASFAEMNSITVDSLFAEDGDPGDDADENIGRFAPIDRRPLTTPPNDDYALATAGLFDTTSDLPTNANWRYNFALDLFDYLDIRSPQDDYLPNVDPGDPSISVNSWLSPAPDAVNNGPGNNVNNANNGKEDGAGEEGKININTAGWRVIATLPMITRANGDIETQANATLAQRIVYYRDISSDGSGAPPHGPFKNLFELNKVPGFRTSIHNLDDFTTPLTTDPDDDAGDISPLGTGGGNGETSSADLVYNDFESTYLTLNRISNLITFRSDSFTVYVLVQGWKNAGTPNPELVVQRRAAYIADRSKVHPLPSLVPNVVSTANTGMSILNVPNN